MPHCLLIHSSNHHRCWASFQVLHGHLYVFCGEGPLKSYCPCLVVSLISRCISCLCFGDKFLVGGFVCTCWFHYEVCLFVVFMVSSAMPVLLRESGVPFIYFVFIFHDSKRWVKKNLPHFMSKCVLFFPSECHIICPFIWVFSLFGVYFCVCC